MTADILESAMLVAFGFAWPTNILKTLSNRSTAGKSLPFLLIVVAGYIFGLAAKYIRGHFNYVVFFYALNLALVLADTCLYFHYLRRERAAAKEQKDH